MVKIPEKKLCNLNKPNHIEDTVFPIKFMTANVHKAGNIDVIPQIL